MTEMNRRVFPTQRNPKRHWYKSSTSSLRPKSKLSCEVLGDDTRASDHSPGSPVLGWACRRGALSLLNSIHKYWNLRTQPELVFTSSVECFGHWDNGQILVSGQNVLQTPWRLESYLVLSWFVITISQRVQISSHVISGWVSNLWIKGEL
jgi:hypothetical protein